jgi:hypothetical protein
MEGLKKKGPLSRLLQELASNAVSAHPPSGATTTSQPE